MDGSKASFVNTKGVDERGRHRVREEESWRGKERKIELGKFGVVTVGALR